MLARRVKRQEWSLGPHLPAPNILGLLTPERKGPLNPRFLRARQTLQHGLMSSLLMPFMNEIQNCWMPLIVE
jgi:hypothetical protein